MVEDGALALNIAVTSDTKVVDDLIYTVSKLNYAGHANKMYELGYLNDVMFEMNMLRKVRFGSLSFDSSNQNLVSTLGKNLSVYFERNTRNCYIYIIEPKYLLS